MSGLLYNADNVVVGNAVLRLAPWVLGDVEPNIADDVPLFSTSDTDWPDPWFSAGATDEGFKLNVDTSTTTVTIEEQSTPVDETVEGKSLSIEAALAEDTMIAMQNSWGGGTIVTTAAASAVPGKQVMPLDNNIKYVTATLEMKNNKGFARRIYIPKMSLYGSGETSFRRSAAKRLKPIRLTSLCPPDQIVITDITAAALP